MRLPYAPSQPPAPTSADDPTTQIYTRIANRRRPRPLIPLDLTLLHSPPVADGWNHLLGALRTQTVLNQGLLELSVCRVAVLNGAIYEWNAHAPLALKAGISEQGLRTCMEVEFGEGRGRVDTVGESGGEEGGLDIKEWTVLAYTDQMTRDIKVEDRLFEVLKGLLTEKEIVELTACVGGYNCVSRFLVALDVGEHNSGRMKGAEELVREMQAK